MYAVTVLFQHLPDIIRVDGLCQPAPYEPFKHVPRLFGVHLATIHPDNQRCHTLLDHANQLTMLDRDELARPEFGKGIAWVRRERYDPFVEGVALLGRKSPKKLLIARGCSGSLSNLTQVLDPVLADKHGFAGIICLNVAEEITEN